MAEEPPPPPKDPPKPAEEAPAKPPAGKKPPADKKAASSASIPVYMPDPDAFEFTNEAMSWKGVHVTCDVIAAAREHAVTSFGSCSFDEPREDLRNLGLL